MLADGFGIRMVEGTVGIVGFHGVMIRYWDGGVVHSLNQAARVRNSFEDFLVNYNFYINLFISLYHMAVQATAL